MRIISGKYAKRKIITPKGSETRPTTDRFKETLFNIIENSLKINLLIAQEAAQTLLYEMIEERVILLSLSNSNYNLDNNLDDNVVEPLKFRYYRGKQLF